MATDPRKRQKKLERRSAKRKEKKHVLIKEQSVGLPDRLTAAAKYPPLHCWIAETVWDEGLDSVLLSRALPDGTVAVAVYLVDRYCLGVKNGFADIIPRSIYEKRFLREMRAHSPSRDVAPACARKLVESAVAYAHSLGFHPHADYEKAKLLFADIDPSECKEDFEFGKDGKPLFFAGPHDTPERCRLILATLMASCGEGNFHYIIPFGDRDPTLPTRISRNNIRIHGPTEEEIALGFPDEDDEDDDDDEEPGWTDREK